MIVNGSCFPIGDHGKFINSHGERRALRTPYIGDNNSTLSASFWRQNRTQSIGSALCVIFHELLCDKVNIFIENTRSLLLAYHSACLSSHPVGHWAIFSLRHKSR